MSTIKFITLCVLLLPLISFGQNVNIKLNCQLSLTRTFNDGKKDNETINEIFEIYQNGKFLSIIPGSDNLQGLTTQKFPTTISIMNFSDENKWGLQSKSKNNNEWLDITVSIDRNTGRISYRQDYQKGLIITDGQGNCKKVDTTKRLF